MVVGNIQHIKDVYLCRKRHFVKKRLTLETFFCAHTKKSSRHFLLHNDTKSLLYLFHSLGPKCFRRRPNEEWDCCASIHPRPRSLHRHTCLRLRGHVEKPPVHHIKAVSVAGVLVWNRWVWPHFNPHHCGQSYKGSMIVIYDTRVVPDLKIPHIMTLEQ